MDRGESSYRFSMSPAAAYGLLARGKQIRLLLSKQEVRYPRCSVGTAQRLRSDWFRKLFMPMNGNASHIRFAVGNQEKKHMEISDLVARSDQPLQSPLVRKEVIGEFSQFSVGG